MLDKRLNSQPSISILCLNCQCTDHFCSDNIMLDKRLNSQPSISILCLNCQCTDHFCSDNIMLEKRLNSQPSIYLLGIRTANFKIFGITKLTARFLCYF